ncbi:NUDIX hydrolase [Paenibacillus piscarius]|uniref:NUDIX hydrolase n=1 Tax=Paenibacillus piscarius TaxID=1089681 RepID=UPI001EE98255|nr:NUDIX pyrophosphatase [Paenibacillus piscarius]
MATRVNVQGFVYCNHPTLQILVLKRTPQRGGYWQPVCGGVENGEAHTEAVLREIAEETGITLIKLLTDLNYTFSYRETKNGVLMDMQDYCYAAEIEHPVDIKLSGEHEAYQWLSYAEAQECLTWEHNLIALERLMQLLRD